MAATNAESKARSFLSALAGRGVSVSSFFDGLSRAPFDGLFVGSGDRSPDAVELAVVLAAVNRDRGAPRDAAPPTPPCVRVRTRRFGGLSMGECVHEDEPFFGERLIAQRAVKRLGSAQAPQPLATHDRGVGRFLATPARLSSWNEEGPVPGRSTALLASLTWSLSRRSRKRVTLAMTRRAAFSLRT